MKKKIIVLFLVVISMFLFTACDLKDDGSVQYDIYKLAKQEGYTGTYEEWLASVKGADGKDGREIEVSIEENNIVWRYVGDTEWKEIYSVDDLIGPKGEDGVSITKIEMTKQEGLNKTYTIYYSNGETFDYTVSDGHSPKVDIGENGNWFIDGVDTTIKAQGPKGDKGDQGDKGDTGKSAYEIYKEKHPEYTGDEAQWLDDLVNGRLANKLKHKVTFNTNGGTTIDTIEVEDGKKITKPIDPIKEGYTFINWTYKGEPWAFFGYVCTEDIVLDANYTENEYTLIVNSNNDINGTVSFTGSNPYKYNTTVELKAKPGNVCLFDGWYDKDSNTLLSKENPYTITIKDNTNIEARFNINDKVRLMGSYPQTKVNKELELDLYNTLKGLVGELPTETNKYKWNTLDTYYEDGNGKDKYFIDITNGKDKYRALYYETKDCYNIITKILDFFKFEPIEWDIISAEGLVISKYVLDKHDYYHDIYNNRTIDGQTIYPNNYEYSDIRKFINGNFFNLAFTEEEKANILTTTVNNGLSSTGDTVNNGICNDALDKLFLLSRAELQDKTLGFTNNYSRQTLLTDYALAVGCKYYYWTRTPYASNSNFAHYVHCGNSNTGYIDNHYVNDGGHRGVRPSFKLAI